MSFFASRRHRLLSLVSFSALVVLCACLPPTQLLADVHEFQQRREALESQFRAECLEILDAEADADQTENDRWRRILDDIRRRPEQNLLFLTGESLLEGRDESTERTSLTRRLAEDLLALADAALQGDEPGLAYDLLHEAAFFDPRNTRVRSILGLAAKGAGNKRSVARRATTRHPLLGWTPRKHWRLQTDHYQIVTNLNPQAGRELADRLEELHTVWRQVFFECWSDQASLRAAWDRQVRLQPSSPRRHRVVLFASRDEYVRFLRPRQPRIEISLGFYEVDSRTSYFFAEADASSQLHEATHQLFQELQPASRTPGAERNFWIVEGVALYMESLRRRGPCATLGGYYADRLQFARYRRLQEGFHVPLDELARLGRDALQQDPRIRRLYSQAAGMSHLLMDGRQGRYRPGLIRYVRDVYAGRDQLRGLEQATETPLTTLDQEYVEFLNVTDQRAAATPPPVNSLRSLCLGRTQITDAALRATPVQNQLEWLDLAHTPVTDQGLALVGDAKTWRQVNLENTAVTDLTLTRIAQSERLDELDLSHTAVTDEGLARLTSLTNLRTLWLAGTSITDASLERLAGMKSLEQLDVEGTQVSAAGKAELKRRLPRLSFP